MQLQDLLERLSSSGWKENLRKSCRANKLSRDIVGYYTPLRLRAAYAKFKAIHEQRPQNIAERWIQNQLKAFYWVCLAISCAQDTTIAMFDERQWGQLGSVFYYKRPITLEYEAKKLVEENIVKSGWTPEEDQLLNEIVMSNHDNLNKWNDHARKLYEQSERGFFRTGKQCRQRWLNHLDTSKKHGQWSKEEDIELAQLVLSQGKKWSQVSKKMTVQRTEHTVKNRFKSIISRQKKAFPSTNSERSLLRLFVNPTAPVKMKVEYEESEQEMQEDERIVRSGEQERREPEIKSEYHSVSAAPRPQPVEEWNQVQEEEGPVRGQQEERIMVPAIACNFDHPNFIPSPGIVQQSQLPQVYSPWYHNYNRTPTFSPSPAAFIINMPSANPNPNQYSFSNFDANLANQFYFPNQGENQ